MVTSIIKIIPLAVFTVFSFNAKAALEKFIMDPIHTSVTWKANHFGFSNPSGKFTKSQGIIMFDEQNPKLSSVNITIDITSITTGIAAFDKHLQGADFFNTAKYGTAIFESTKVVRSGKNAKIHGNLTLLGITKPVILDAKLNKIGEHPFTKKRTIGFSAKTAIKRSEFGMNYILDGVSDKIQIEIEVEASVE